MKIISYLRFLFVSSLFLTVFPAFSSEDLNENLTKGRQVAQDLLENGYFVHLTPMNLFEKDIDFKLRGGAVVSKTIDVDSYLQLIRQLLPPEGIAELDEITKGQGSVGKAVTYIPVPESFRPLHLFLFT